MDLTSRAAAEELDARDPLASFRERFLHADPGLIYLDGNSLGRLPLATAGRLASVVRDDWGTRLIRAWPERWSDLPHRVGDRIGRHFLGAAPGQVVVADSTTVNFYKLACAALDLADPRRRVIVTDRDNFPTDRYVLEGIAASRGLMLRFVEFDELTGPAPADIEAVTGEDTALLTLSHIDYRSAAIADMAGINEVARRAGVRVLWDLSHSVGSVPVELDATGTDLAVGCCYKYLNGGPGAPAFLYVRGDLADRVLPPIWGWHGQRAQFAMGHGFDPVPGVGRFLAGTPPVLSLAAVEEGVAVVAEAGIGRLRDKGAALTDLAIALADAWLTGLGFTLASPRDSGRRGSHVSLRHSNAAKIVQALAEHADVVPDFRCPDLVRLGLAPINTRFTDVWDALDRLRALVSDGYQHLGGEAGPKRLRQPSGTR